jgi:hypothetical protein
LLSPEDLTEPVKDNVVVYGKIGLLVFPGFIRHIEQLIQPLLDMFRYIFEDYLPRHLPQPDLHPVPDIRVIADIRKVEAMNIRVPEKRHSLDTPWN